jgi:probable dihydroxyacetone kinase regulator
MASNLTKQAIVNSFVKLLNERPLDKITVKDVVEDCNINRNTFYYHYQDIYALLADIFEHEATKVVEENEEHQTWQEGFIQSTQFVLQNKKAIYHVYSSAHREYFERYLYKVAGDLMHKFVTKQAEGLDVDEEDIHYVEIFYKHALVGIFFEWIDGGMKIDPEHVIKRMGEIFDGNIQTTLERASKSK